MPETIVETPSCWNCKYCASWSYPDTRDEPGDSGWECRLQGKNETIEALEEKYGDLLAEVAVVSIAAECPEYGYQAPHQDYDEPAEEFTEEERQRQEASREAAELEQYIKAGLYDPIAQQLTPEFYAHSDWAYQTRNR